MLAQSPVAGDTRILREATSLADDGHEVTVVGRSVPRGFQGPAGVRIVSVDRGGGLGSAGVPASAPAGSASLVAVARRAGRWLLLPEHRQRVESGWCAAARPHAVGVRPHVVHAHDFNTLALAADVAADAGAHLVYDTHEFWAGRPRVGRPTPWRRRREAATEARLGRSAAAVLTVGEGVARELRDRYGWQHVRVVRNTFPDLGAVPAVAGPGPDGASGAPARRPQALVYAGRLAADRELEVIAAASERLDLPVVLVGPADDVWLSRFDARRAQVRPPLDVDAVDAVLAEAGLALVTHSDRWLNHRLALPNKLFHAVRVGIPVVATDVGELARAVREHDLGELYSPGDAAGLAAATSRAVSRYDELVSSVRVARTALSWAPDRDVLLRLYRELAADAR